MKILPKLLHVRSPGFTVAEMYVCMAIFVMLILALTACQLFAMRIYTLAATKLTATAAARKAMNAMRDEIKEASMVQVGIYNPTTPSFNVCTNGTLQIGNAVAVYPWNNTNFATIYYMDQVNSNLSSIVLSNGTLQASTLSPNIVVYITNYFVFDAEDSFTNILTTPVNDRVIHVKFQFAQWEYPLAGAVGPNAMYDYYQLQTRASRRLGNF